MNALTLSIILVVIAFLVLVTMAAYTVYAERKVAAAIQQRVGPNRVGPLGLLQPLADVLKLLLKEDIVPASADKLVHFIAPVIAVGISFVTMAVIPFAKADLAMTEATGGFLTIANVNIGVLYILAISSVAVYGVTLAGWSSNSKYALLGGLRSSAQMISYELAMGLSVVSVILLTNYRFEGADGFLSPGAIVEAQRGAWNFLVNPIGAIIFITCAFAEANRAPFDLVEAEQELVGGFHTEYSSTKFASFFLAEYVHVIVASMLITTFFFGGYLSPIDGFLDVAGWAPAAQLAWSLGWFMLKTLFFVFVFIWVRWTLPRFKYNQLMDLGWKKFLPLALLNLVVIAGVIAFLST
ncbi:NADH-quinone oxidoreductase subunit NuoH [Pontibacter sp. G13]|uniref:NADH-quinone oxidoreductase subunit NuoH n=1 Tax=Pontibacter sp. G13 TaxID=3074898 RepID=UPI002889812F|nr:NADH-quinone oxidoreductase subunit NuoH [Pontibacter sp. G13]WNJ16368.1 NADH-quinone oxidoreductase subunit NuoH [Pontibacter sp. G13]